MKHEQTWDLLAEVLAEIVYTRDPLPDGRRFIFDRDYESNYAVLYVRTYNPNTYHPARMRTTYHEFVVPVTTYHKAAWTRWVFDRIASIELHETCESFQIPGPDGELYRPYAPHHGNGWDPYTIWYDGHPDEQAKAPGEG